jgi:hypothetical protein
MPYLVIFISPYISVRYELYGMILGLLERLITNRPRIGTLPIRGLSGMVAVGLEVIVEWLKWSI